MLKIEIKGGLLMVDVIPVLGAGPDEQSFVIIVDTDIEPEEQPVPTCATCGGNHTEPCPQHE